jgi:molybdate transport system ATP-binding protein
MTLALDIRLRQGQFRMAARCDLPDGITAVFGPSGSGKSSLLAAIAGLRQAQGTALLNGQSLQNLPPHRRGIGLVFQEPRLFPHLSAGGNIHYGWKRADPSRRRAIVEVAQFFDIEALLDRPVTNMSGGEQARVALARALVASPNLLLLDEPFAALDGIRRRTFIRVLRDTYDRFGIPMIVVTHAIDDAAALADHVVALQNGVVAAQGPFADATRTPAFQALLDARDTGSALAGQVLVQGSKTPVRAVWLRADHVLLASRKPEALSARNVLQGTVTAITDDNGARLVELSTAVGPVLSRLTPDAVAELALAPGREAWAVVKAHAL